MDCNNASPKARKPGSTTTAQMLAGANGVVIRNGVYTNSGGYVMTVGPGVDPARVKEFEERMSVSKKKYQGNIEANALNGAKGVTLSGGSVTNSTFGIYNFQDSKDKRHPDTSASKRIHPSTSASKRTHPDPTPRRATLPHTTYKASIVLDRANVVNVRSIENSAIANISDLSPETTADLVTKSMEVFNENAHSLEATHVIEGAVTGDIINLAGVYKAASRKK